MKYALSIVLMLLLGCVTQPPPEPNATVNGSNQTYTNISANDTQPQKISTFEECVAAGNPVMESYPRQCRAGNMTFVSLTDFFQVNKDTGCAQDSDCALVDESLGFSCCWAGSCAQINYSEDKWVAVNATWYSSERDRNCPGDCGPAPGCPIRIINASFVPVCQSGICEKIESVIVEEANISEVPGNLSNETLPEGIAFGGYRLVLDDVVLPAYDSTCGAFSVVANNGSTLDKLLICEKKSKNWVSPQGHSYRIFVVKVVGGYSHQAAWADVRIYG
jgi:hypothetical protein